MTWGRALDDYAAMVAYAVRLGPCLTGHDWWEATYTTVDVSCDLNRPDNRACGFVQCRVCNRCGHPVTHVGRLRGGEFVVTLPTA